MISRVYDIWTVHELFMKNNAFYKIRGHLVILPFYKTQTKASGAPLRKKAIEFEVEIPDTPNCYTIILSNIGGPNFSFSQI